MKQSRGVRREIAEVCIATKFGFFAELSPHRSPGEPRLTAISDFEKTKCKIVVVEGSHMKAALAATKRYTYTSTRSNPPRPRVAVQRHAPMESPSRLHPINGRRAAVTFSKLGEVAVKYDRPAEAGGSSSRMAR